MKKKQIDVWNASDINMPYSKTVRFDLSEPIYQNLCEHLHSGYLFDYQKVPQYDLIVLFGTITVSRYCSTIRNFQLRFRGLELIAECFDIPILLFDFGYVSKILKEKWNTDTYKLMDNSNLKEFFDFIKLVKPQKTLIVFGSMRYSPAEKHIYTDITKAIKNLIMGGE